MSVTREEMQDFVDRARERRSGHAPGAPGRPVGDEDIRPGPPMLRTRDVSGLVDIGTEHDRVSPEEMQRACAEFIAAGMISADDARRVLAGRLNGGDPGKPIADSVAPSRYVPLDGYSIVAIQPNGEVSIGGRVQAGFSAFDLIQRGERLIPVESECVRPAARASAAFERIHLELRALDERGRNILRDLAETGPGIARIPGIPPRAVATVGYDDPTGDDMAADWRRS